jgi:hypothetical protein
LDVKVKVKGDQRVSVLTDFTDDFAKDRTINFATMTVGGIGSEVGVAPFDAADNGIVSAALATLPGYKKIALMVITPPFEAGAVKETVTLKSPTVAEILVFPSRALMEKSEPAEF